MPTGARHRLWPGIIWASLALLITVPIVAAALSPLLAWRQPVYIGAGFAGILGMALLLVQPLLAAGLLPGLRLTEARRLHLWAGRALVGLVLLHVGGLWITSPPDVIDALLLAAPTPFSVWGVCAMWATFLSAGLVFMRAPAAHWRIAHRALGLVIVASTALHALLIEGTMEPFSKTVLCGMALVTTALSLGRMARRPGSP